MNFYTNSPNFYHILVHCDKQNFKFCVPPMTSSCQTLFITKRIRWAKSFIFFIYYESTWGCGKFVAIGNKKMNKKVATFKSLKIISTYSLKHPALRLLKISRSFLLHTFKLSLFRRFPPSPWGVRSADKCKLKTSSTNCFSFAYKNNTNIILYDDYI